MFYLGQHYFKQHSFTVSIHLVNIQIPWEPIIVQQTAGNQIIKDVSLPSQLFCSHKTQAKESISSLDSIIIFKNIILDIKILRDKINFFLCGNI